MSCKNWSEKSDCFSTEDLRFEEEHSPHHSKKAKRSKQLTSNDQRQRNMEKTEAVILNDLRSRVT